METRTHHARSLRRGIISALILFVSLLPLLATAQLHDVRLRVLDPDGEYTGTAVGITEEGELLVLRDDQSLTAVRSGEVSVRGIYGYV